VTLWPGLSRKESWRRYCDKPPRAQLERLTPARLRALGDAAREEYDESRYDWHRNLAIVETRQLTAVHKTLNMIVQSNRQDDADRIRGVGAIDAFPGLGKTTIADTFARAFDRADIRRRGPLTAAGHPRLPVFRVSLSAGTTVKSLNEKICQFYGHPAMKRALRGYSADRLAGFALDCVLSSETKLGIIDDVHFITPRRKDGLDVINHLKYLNSEFPVTFLFAGVDLRGKGFFSDPQLARRWTRLEVAAFEIVSDEGRADWQSLIKGHRAAARPSPRAARHAYQHRRLPVRADHRPHWLLLQPHHPGLLRGHPDRGGRPHPRPARQRPHR
jgi:AAA domain